MEQPLNDVSGQILVDGSPPPSSFKYMVGYVVQDAIICQTLTVRENLMFSVNIRLPSRVSHSERLQKVSKIITEFGLESCADTKIGTEFIRGVSGGERKRTCICMELILAPKILFLDEPTTGLDTATAEKVMKYLNGLAKQGHTIIFSIHQPRSSIYKLFDTITLLSDGEMVYHGKPTKMLDYFSKLGYTSDSHDNPADFVIDVLISVEKKPKELEKLKRAYKTSSMNQSGTNFTHKHLTDGDNFKKADSRKDNPVRSFFKELYYLSQRTLRNTFRDPEIFLAQVIVAIILGFLIGLVYYDIQKTPDPGVQNLLGALFMVVVTQIFSTLTALEPLINERALYIHEYISGYYRSMPFFITKFLCDILLIRIIVSIIFSVIVYFLIGLERDAGRFFVFLLTIILSSLFGSILCLLVTATVRLMGVALIITVLIFLIMMIFSGFLIALKTIFNWLSWLQYVSVFRYAFNMLALNEFRTIKFCFANATDVCPLTGLDVLKSRDLSYDTNWDLWKNCFAIGMMTIGVFILAFIQLTRIKKTK